MVNRHFINFLKYKKIYFFVRIHIMYFIISKFKNMRWQSSIPYCKKYNTYTL